MSTAAGNAPRRVRVRGDRARSAWPAGTSWCSLAVLAAALVCLPASAAADPSASAPTAAAGDTDLRVELQRAREELTEIRSTAPDTASADLLTARARAASRLVELLAARIDDAQVRPAPAAAPVPLALAGSAPYAVAAVDALRDQADRLTAQRAALRPLMAALDADLQLAVAKQRKAGETLRLRREQAERARGGDATAGARAELQLARLEHRVAELELVRVEAALGAARDRLALLAAPIELLEERVAAARRSQRIDADDLAALQRGVDVQLAELADWRRRLEADFGARAGAATAPPQARQAAEGRDALAALRELEAVVAGQAAVWQQRRAALDAAASGDAAARRSARLALERSLDQARAHERAIGERLVVLRSEFELQRPRVGVAVRPALPAAPAGRTAPRSGPAAPAVSAPALPAIDGLQAQAAIDERLQAELARIVVLLERSLSDLVLEGEAGRTRDGWALAWSRIVGWAETLWQYELFSATDSVTVDGRQLALDYGVTVGKSIGVAGLFVIGWWAAARVTRRLIDALVRRGTIGAPLARVLRRWVMTLLLLLVVWVVLKLARVPLAAFAFLGGALAIGVGFAAQNLLKNLMSGAIILFERKIRVGDTVTVGGVSGTVAAVDLRSTTVRGFDGIESILPNSYLIENIVADWSHGDGRIRSQVLVPVAYGTATGEAAEFIMQCLRAHPDVLPQPAPLVLLDDFGADGPVYKLWYWTSLRAERAAPLVASDLRMAIEREFAACGIRPPRSRHDVAMVDAPRV